MANLLGIDLSHWQNVTNYAALRNYADFFYIKVTQADNYVDPAWSQHYGKLAGKPRAPYHFLGRAGNIPGQVRAFRTQYERVGWEWGPVLDAEYQPGAPVPGSVIKAWIQEWRRQTGKQLLYVYVGNADANGSAPLSSFVLDGNVRVIIARYYTAARSSAWSSARLGRNLNHPNLDITQYWDKASVPGVAGQCDVNDARRLHTTAGAATTVEDDVSKQDALDALREYFNSQWHDSRVPGSKAQLSLRDAMLNADSYTYQLKHFFNDPGSFQSRIPGDTNKTNGGDAIADTVARVSMNQGALADARAQLAGLKTAVEALAQNSNITADELRDMINDAVAAHVNITGTVAISGAEEQPETPEDPS